MNISINDIRLLKSDFEVNFEANEPFDGNIPIEIKCRASFVEEKRSFRFVQNISCAKGNYPFVFHIEYGAEFILSEVPSDNERNRLCKVNFPAIIFPFIREYIADITRRAGLKPLVIDPQNFAANIEKEQKDSA